ncbi:C40 family peptidase [Pseudomonas sp. Hp2]|uniref:C40 family peptidase n=1 Tax=Pseudomonas sp. Hp2 TaxID=701189 RepID=UPI00112A25CD|nr:C40 family peptidase [Pseudomonas sp. Hp2]
MAIGDVGRFTQIPYDEASFDCADLVVMVQRELFGREIELPSQRPRGVQGQAVIGRLSRSYARRREGSPQDGDLVLMIDHGQRRPGHAGVFFFLAHEGWVLHTNEQNGCSVLHRTRELSGWGLRIEGYYEWI